MNNLQELLNILAMNKKVQLNKHRFLSMLEDNVMLWSDDYLEERRKDFFMHWCFETGSSEDLAKFEELNQELEKRREETRMKKIWEDAIKEDPVWRDHYENVLNGNQIRARRN